MGCLPPFSTGDSDFAGPSTVFGRPWQVELLAQRLRDQVDSSGREGNATAAWLRFFPGSQLYGWDKVGLKPLPSGKLTV